MLFGKDDQQVDVAVAIYRRTEAQFQALVVAADAPGLWPT
jgi:hypothetical protein